MAARIILPLALFLVATIATAQEKPNTGELFRQALEDARAGRLIEAIVLMERVDSLEQGHPEVLWNLGAWNARLERFERSLHWWSLYRTVAPDDWHGIEKLVQIYQALGDTAARDRERAALFERRSIDTSLAAEEDYERDRFAIDGRRFIGYETFAPSGDRMVFYAIYEFDSTGESIARYSMGSYDATTEISRQTGSIGPDDRIYHLDHDYPSGHATYGFYGTLPTWDEFRAMVIDAVTGESRPVSSSRYPAKEK